MATTTTEKSETKTRKSRHPAGPEPGRRGRDRRARQGDRPRARRRSRSSSARARSCASARGSPSRARSRSIPTGSLGLDIALGIGGLPRGRIVEIYGPESSGKTTLTLHVVAEAQKRGGVCAFIDAEHALDVGYAQQARRARPTSCSSSQPDYGEQALEIADMLVRSNAVDVIVIDSVAALTPQGRDRGRDGRRARRPAGAPHEPGAAQADRRRSRKSRTHGHLHQPDPHEDRRHVRQPGDDDRRQRAQVLRVGAPRHPPHRRDQERRGRRSATARA